MPGGGGKEGQKATLTETEIWQLVDYVLSLPYDDPTHAPAAKAEHHAGNARGEDGKIGRREDGQMGRRGEGE
jgi:hypothetical protein